MPKISFIFFTLAPLITFAVTQKDLPKLPLPVEITKKTNKPKTQHHSRGIESVDFLPVIPDEDRDLNVLPQEEKLGEEELRLDQSEAAPNVDLNEPGENIDRFEEDTPQEKQPSGSLAPGLKSHKKKPKPQKTPEERSSHLVKIKGVLLVGSRDMIEGLDLSEIEGVEVDGVQAVYNLDVLKKNLTPLYEGKLFVQKNVKAIQDQILATFLDNQWAVVSVSIPLQDIDSEVLVVVVEESRLGQIDVIGEKYLDRQWILETLDFRLDQRIDLRLIDQKVEFFNLNPFQHAEVLLKPMDGTQTNQADVFVGDRFPLSLYFGSDNQGMEALGAVRTYYGANYAYLASLNDLLSFQYTASTDFQRYQSFTGDYRLYLAPYCVLNLFGGYVSDQQVEEGVLLNEGYSMQASLRLNHPHWITPATRLTIEIGLDYKNTNNNLEYVNFDPKFTQPCGLTQLVALIGWKQEWEIAKVDLNLKGFFSLGDLLPDATVSRFEQQRAGANPHYVYGTLEVDSTFFYLKTGEVNLRVKGQLASTNLLPSEEWALGGLETVRGYIESAAIGDQGYFFSLTGLSPSVSVLRPRMDRRGNLIEDQLQAALFFDLGSAYAKTKESSDATSQPGATTIMSIGPGAKYSIRNYVDAEVYIGWKLKSGSFDPTHSPFANFKASLRF